jgi:ankyrin repeat protein
MSDAESAPGLRNLPWDVLRKLALNLSPPGPLSLSLACRSFHSALCEVDCAAEWLSTWHPHDQDSLFVVIRSKQHGNTLPILQKLAKEHNVILPLGGNADLGRTLLHAAIASGASSEVVTWLLHSAGEWAARMDREAKDSLGESSPSAASALSLGQTMQQDDAAGSVSPTEGCRGAIPLEPDQQRLEAWLNARDKGGATALGLACILGRVDLVKLLGRQPSININVATGMKCIRPRHAQLHGLKHVLGPSHMHTGNLIREIPIQRQAVPCPPPLIGRDDRVIYDRGIGDGPHVAGSDSPHDEDGYGNNDDDDDRGGSWSNSEDEDGSPPSRHHPMLGFASRTSMLQVSDQDMDSEDDDGELSENSSDWFHNDYPEQPRGSPGSTRRSFVMVDASEGGIDRSEAHLSVLQFACSRGHLDLAEELMRHQNIGVNRIAWAGLPALFYALDSSPLLFQALVANPKVNLNISHGEKSAMVVSVELL